MKKGVKVLIGVVILVFILAIIYVSLVISKVLPNPFLDKSDLYCYRDGVKYDTYKLDKYIVFSFDKWGTFVSGETQNHFIFRKKENAEKKYNVFYEMYGEESENVLKIEDKTVILKGDLDFSLDIKNMNRKQIKERYSELGYECK